MVAAHHMVVEMETEQRTVVEMGAGLLTEVALRTVAVQLMEVAHRTEAAQLMAAEPGTLALAPVAILTTLATRRCLARRPRTLQIMPQRQELHTVVRQRLTTLRLLQVLTLLPHLVPWMVPRLDRTEIIGLLLVL